MMHKNNLIIIDLFYYIFVLCGSLIFRGCKQQNIDTFKANCEQYGYKAEQILPHDSYL